MTCLPAPTCKVALKEATERWPNRSRLSDGICGDASHTSKSDHYYGNAFDLTHDPANGCDAHALADYLRVEGDPRGKYIISNSRIANPGGDWRPYTGPNPHDKHIHVSIWDDARNDIAPWWAQEETVYRITFEDGKVYEFTDVLVHEGTGGLWALRADGGIFTVKGPGGEPPFHGAYNKGVEEGWQAIKLEPFKDGYMLVNNKGQTYHFPNPNWSPVPPSSTAVNEDAIVQRAVTESVQEVQKRLAA